MPLLPPPPLSNRYIADRFLPDNAIDLIDEAASRLRIEIDSMPYEIDVIERRLRQLEIEQLALKKEKDRSGKERLKAIEAEMADLRENLNAKKAQWQMEKERIDAIRSIQARIDEARREEEIAERQGQLDKVAEIRYGRINELQQKLEAENKRLAEIQSQGSFLSEEVTEEHVSKNRFQLDRHSG